MSFWEALYSEPDGHREASFGAVIYTRFWTTGPFDITPWAAIVACTVDSLEEPPIKQGSHYDMAFNDSTRARLSPKKVKAPPGLRMEQNASEKS